MPFARPQALLDEIERQLPDRPFTIRTWDGGLLRATSGDGEVPTFTVRSPQAIAHALRAPGQIGLGRAYVSGEIDVDDMDATIALLSNWQPPAIDAAGKRRLMLAAVRAMGLTSIPAPPPAELRPRGKRH